MFSDIRSVIDSSMTPYATIHKKYVALSFIVLEKLLLLKLLDIILFLGLLALKTSLASIRNIHRSSKYYSLFYFSKVI